MSPTPEQIAQAAALNKEWGAGLNDLAAACFKVNLKDWGMMLRRLAEHHECVAQVLAGKKPDIELSVIAMQYPPGQPAKK